MSGGIKTPVRRLVEGEAYTPGPDEWVITEDHTLSDVIDWLVGQAGGGEDGIDEILSILTGHRFEDLGA